MKQNEFTHEITTLSPNKNPLIYQKNHMHKIRPILCEPISIHTNGRHRDTIFMKQRVYIHENECSGKAGELGLLWAYWCAYCKKHNAQSEQYTALEALK